MKVRLLQLWILLISIIGIYYYGVLSIWVSIFLYLITNVIIGNAMLHRYYGHRSFKMKLSAEKMSRWLCHHLPMGSVIGWSAYHRLHHKHSDTELDVHSPTIQGYFHIIFGVWENKISKKVVKDLLTPELIWWHKHYFTYHITLSVVLLWLFPWCLVFVYAIPNFLNLISALLIAIVPHRSGEVSNSLMLDIVTLGEGKHNYHHKYPFDYKYGKYDLTGIFIERVLKK